MLNYSPSSEFYFIDYEDPENLEKSWSKISKRHMPLEVVNEAE